MKQYGPYIVQDTLGRGGMGTVFRGKHAESGDVVAIKVLSKEYSESDHFRVRFESEIETLFKLHHPNIVQLISYGQDEGEMFFAMELVEGRSLHVEQKLTGRIHWRDVILMTLDICKGLRHAHDRGVIHRDIKPGNLLLGPNKIVKITDFGIAKLFGGTQLTAHGGVVGTADFMSPEQARGEMITQRSDLYSLGCVMFSLLTKRPPLPSKSIHEAIQAITTKTPPAVTKFAAGIPEPLSQLISRLLEKDPEKRIGSAHALSKRLNEILEELQNQAEAKTQSAPPADEFEVVETGKKKNLDTPGKTVVRKTVDEPSEPDMTKGSAFKTVDSPDAGQKNDQTLASKAHPKVRSDDQELTLEQLDEPSNRSRPTKATTQQNTERQSFFTEVDQSPRRTRPRPVQKEESSPLVIWAIVAALLLVLGMAIIGILLVLLQADTADELYEKIAQRADRPSAVKTEIAQFLDRFPDDERAKQVEQMKFQADSRKYLRRLELKSRLKGPSELLPIESAFIMAMENEHSDPVTALSRLQSLSEMYSATQGELSQSGQICLSAVKGQINLLKPIAFSYTSKHTIEIKRVISSTVAMEDSRPELAMDSYRGVIDVYGPQPWASAFVNIAREKLKFLQERIAAGENPAENDPTEEEDATETSENESDLESTADPAEKKISAEVKTNAELDALISQTGKVLLVDVWALW